MKIFYPEGCKIKVFQDKPTKDVVFIADYIKRLNFSGNSVMQATIND